MSKSATVNLTEEALQRIVAQAVAQALQSVQTVQPKVEAKPVKSVTVKSQPKVAVQPVKSAKPTTRKEAIAEWKKPRHITPETQDAYKRLYAENFANDWAEWTSSEGYKSAKGAERKSLNQDIAKMLRNSYRKQAGMSKLSFEK